MPKIRNCDTCKQLLPCENYLLGKEFYPEWSRDVWYCDKCNYLGIDAERYRFSKYFSLTILGAFVGIVLSLLIGDLSCLLWTAGFTVLAVMCRIGFLRRDAILRDRDAAFDYNKALKEEGLWPVK